MTEVQKIMAVLEAMWEIVKLFGSGAAMVMMVALVVMAILKQFFGISTKKLVYNWLRIK